MDEGNIGSPYIPFFLHMRGFSCIASLLYSSCLSSSRSMRQAQEICEKMLSGRDCAVEVEAPRQQAARDETTSMHAVVQDFKIS